MIELQSDATDKQILAAIEAWVELLAADKFEEAYEQVIHREDAGWTPQLMRDVIANYGSIEARKDGKVFRVTSPSQVPVDERYIFEVERYGDDPNRPQEYIGMAAYALPLNGEWSDLTLMFDLVLMNGSLALRLDDIRVL